MENPSAFPRLTALYGNCADESKIVVHYDAESDDGMTLRDYFAARALQGWYSETGGLPHEDNLSGYAAHFYRMADAMLKARKVEP